MLILAQGCAYTIVMYPLEFIAGLLWSGCIKKNNSYASLDMNCLLIERVIDYLASLLYLGRLFHFGESVDFELP